MFSLNGEVTVPDKLTKTPDHLEAQFLLPVGTYSVKISATGYSNLNADPLPICKFASTRIDYPKENLVSSGKRTQIPVTIPVTGKLATTTASGSGKGSGSFSGDLHGYVRQPTTTVPAAVGTATAPQATQSVTPGTLGSERQPASPAGTTGAGASTGTLGVVTTPAGATIFIDGVQRAVSPASIPGLEPGDHTLLLRFDGYQDFTAPITIEAGKTQKYTTALVQNATQVNTTTIPATPKKSPGFAVVLALAGHGVVLCLRKGRAG